MLTLDAPWLDWDLGAEMPVISWALNRPGITTARHIIWREVKNADLPPGMDVVAWLKGELASRNRAEAVAFLTSRNVSVHHVAEATEGRTTAQAVATVGLSNAERVGARVDYSRRDWGTINVALRLDAGLTQAALIEALSIATQARTAAVMDADFRLPTGVATGTGTDCIAVAAPAGDTGFAGLHTDAGAAIGRAVYTAVAEGTARWLAKSFRGNHDIEEAAQ
ncbi:adenosylcobinamide amidohydrolase [Aliiroseovarius sp.]|uniref:adenosylcobinamide amidohydrolase n=1 Tax=Aliiroseovarius sp. TaxID=1872442 RepID=UPI0026016814|nr:adenosylcobinamide amidohydrolase [Aliiroseovarius sp.]